MACEAHRMNNLMIEKISCLYLNIYFVKSTASIRKCVVIYKGRPKNFLNNTDARAVLVARYSAASYTFNHTFSLSVPSGIDVEDLVYLQ